LSEPVYETNPDAAPDEDFLAGELSLLLVGNRGRLLDARRTPIVVTAVAPSKGAFEVRIEAFEDRGARWELPLDEVRRFQFAREARRTGPDELAELEAAREHFDRQLEIEAAETAQHRTLDRIEATRGALRERVARASRPPSLESMIARREGDPELFVLTEEVLAERGLDEIDRRFADTFASNPHSGELIKGHAIVLAELGLCTYRGRIVRDPQVFADPWSKEARAEHLITRLALSRELWSGWGYRDVTLYRGAAVDRDAASLRPGSSFVSATFSPEVAEEHFRGGPTTRTALMWRRQVPIERPLMTFVETRALNARFKEAEAVLVAEPGSEGL
jgi:hypothetical protein